MTIAASVRTTVLGGSVELSGNVSGGPQTAQQLIVVAKPYQGAETRTAVTTESDGDWSLRVRPRIRTEYQVEWGNTVSDKAPIVYVRPRVQLRVLNRMTGRLYVKVTALRPYRGKLVTLQRLTSRGSWVKVRRPGSAWGRSPASRRGCRRPRGSACSSRALRATSRAQAAPFSFAATRTSRIASTGARVHPAPSLFR